MIVQKIKDDGFSVKPFKQIFSLNIVLTYAIISLQSMIEQIYWKSVAEVKALPI